MAEVTQCRWWARIVQDAAYSEDDSSRSKSVAVDTEKKVQEILSHWEEHRENLIPILQDVQVECYHLPQNALRQIASNLAIPLKDVFHVATFYNCFSLQPRGKHLIQVCLGTACHVSGGERMLEKICHELRLPLPGTSDDYEFTVRAVRCLGCCGLAPVMRVDHDTHAHLAQGKIRGILNRYRRARKAA